MVSKDVSARLGYLNASAQLLATSAPETSRFLMSKYNSLILDNEIDLPDTARNMACTSCGNLIILGREGTLKGEASRPHKSRSRSRQELKKVPKAMIYKCDSCDKKTQFPIYATAKSPRYNMKAPKPNSIASAKHSIPSVPIPTTATVKKRARSKKLGGLDALLANQKTSQSTSNGFGLDLMDFMKQGERF